MNCQPIHYVTLVKGLVKEKNTSMEILKICFLILKNIALYKMKNI